MKTLQKDLSLSAVVAGLVAVTISYAGPALILFQAANAASLTAAQLSSWIWAVSIGSGITGVALSLRYRTPVITAWSTPGAALLVVSLPGVSYSDAIGAFIFAAAVIALLGISGLFERLMTRLPQQIAAAMLAGILFRFGIDVFAAIKTQAAMVIAMFGAYVLLRRALPRYAVVGALAVGVVIAAFGDLFAFNGFALTLAQPLWTTPTFSWATLVSIGVPLCLVTMTGQHMPGMAVLRTAGYRTSANPLVSVTSIGALLLAPFGAHGINLAAITAAICTGREAHEDPSKRYVAGVVAGLAYVVIGLFGAALVALFAALPKELIATIAGLALLGAMTAGLSKAMADEAERESAFITFIVTASGVTLLGLGAAFWGLIAGVGARVILHGSIQRRWSARRARRDKSAP
ncbi:MAG: benzoate/H(+) symporter BenE family transporter [Gammaproteobacteria bacterium]|nr:benzoate/H(+) symporter BenE family transporter [Gammaproteobacteria bacterium]